MSLSPAELEIYQKLKNDFAHYSSRCLKIRTKSGAIEPFIMNKAQLYVHQMLEAQKGATGKVRALILKARQQGMSTYIGARFFHQTTVRKGIQTFIMAHNLSATDNLFKMSQRFYEHLPSEVRPTIQKSNAKELIFNKEQNGLDSGYKLGTAGNAQIGRSSTIQLLHGSEIGFWPNAGNLAAGLFQAVPDMPGTEIILESTANGVGNFFHQKWQEAEAGLNDFIAIFVPWHWQAEYAAPVAADFKRNAEEESLCNVYGLNDEQLCWRRKKITELSVDGVDGAHIFPQEYPACAAESFILTGQDNYIAGSVVLNARKTQQVEKIGPIIIGVDPARFGDDRTCIIRRQGRIAYGLESHIKKDTMEISGIVHKIILNEQPTKVCIDVGGLGAGVFDRLKELGHQDVIVAVNFGGKPLDAAKYKNKKAEMWGLMLEWLNDEPCQIPDSDELQSDLCNTKYRIDSNSRLEMESKETMKKRGVRSSDAADSLAMTFALPNSALSAKINNKHAETLHYLAQSMQKTRELVHKSRFK